MSEQPARSETERSRKGIRGHVLVPWPQEPGATALARHESQMRALATAGAISAVAGSGLLGEHLRSEDGERQLYSGLAALLAAVLLLAAALYERSQRDLERRRVAPRLAPPPNL